MKKICKQLLFLGFSVIVLSSSIYASNIEDSSVEHSMVYEESFKLEALNQAEDIDKVQNTYSLKDPFSGNIKEIITYYKEIAPPSSKTDEIFVKFTDSALVDEWIKQLNDFYDFKEISVSNYLKSIDVYVLKFISVDEADIAIDFLNKFDEVIYAEPHYEREL